MTMPTAERLVLRFHNLLLERTRIVAFGIGLSTAALIGLSYWAVAVLVRPDEPMSVRIMYRYEDTDYLPLIYALARLKLHEFVTPESSGLLIFPLLMDMPHAAMIALFGNWGFAVADMAVMLAWFVLFFLLARVFTKDTRAAVLIGLLMLVAAGPWSWPGLQGRSFEVWGFRYTRPFIAGLFMLGLVLTTRTIVASLLDRRGRPGVYAAHGLLLGGAAQGDMHLAITGCFVTAALYLFFLFARQSRRLSLRAVLLTSAGFALGVLPIAVQQAVAGHSDYTARLGMFPVDRLSPPFYLDAGVAVGLARMLGLWAVIWMLARRCAATRMRDINLLLGVIFCFMVFAILAISLSTIVMGHGFLLYEFEDRRIKFNNLGYVVGLGLLFVLGYHAWWNRHKISNARMPFSALLIGGLLLVGVSIVGVSQSAVMAANRGERTAQPRVFDSPAEGGFGWPIFPNYRSDFTELASELSRPQYDGSHVLATFDQQMGMWWLAFSKGHLFIPDPFVSTVPDSTIEERTLGLLHLVGASPEFLDHKLEEQYFIERFLFADKWQASPAYTYRQIEDYSPQQIKRIRTTSVLDSWSVLIPRSERERLLAAFNRIAEPERLPELIVLPRGAGYEELPGPGTPYRLGFENSTFRVWMLPSRDD